MSEIKEAILSVIGERIDRQQAKGLAKYGTTIDGVSVDAYNWQDEAMEEMIDLLQYQQKRIMKLQRDVSTAETFGELQRLKYMKCVEGEG